MRRRVLDANEKRKLRRLWRGDQTNEEVAHEMELSFDELTRIAKYMGLGERLEPDVYIPSRVQIQVAAAEIRSKWSSHEREARLEAARSVRINSTERQ